MATLTPQQQAEADRAAITAFGQQVLGAGNKLGAAFNDLITLPVRGVAGAVNTALRVPNAFGAGIPFIPDNGWLTSMTPFSDRLQTPAALPAPVAPATSGGPDRVGGAQAMPTQDPASVVAKASGAAAPKKGAATAAPPPRTPTAAPAATPEAEPLIPGVTGFFMNDQLVPFGTRFAVNGNGVTQLNNFSAAPAAAGGATVGGSRAGQVASAMPTAGGAVGAIPFQSSLIDPRTYFAEVVKAQMQFADAAAQRILDQAGSGRELGFSAKLRALASIYNNGLAQVGQGGANNFNSSSASMANAATDAASRALVSNNALTGDLARANATLGAAQIGADASLAVEDRRDDRHFSTPVMAGQQMLPGVGGIPTPVTTFAVPQRRGAMPKPVTELSTAPKEGDTGKTTTGQAVVFKNGKWVAAGN